MTWFTANQVSVNNGSTIVTVTSGEDISNIRAGDALIVGSFSPVEINRAYVDGSNNKIIELKSAWSDSNQSNAAARVFPTAGDFKEAANALRDATQLTSDQFQTLTDWGTINGTVTFTDSSGQQYTARSLAKMDADVAAVQAQAESLVGSVVLPTKADFESRHEGKYAGSGFVEWGKHHTDDTSSVYAPINQGMWPDVTNPNTLIMGLSGTGVPYGVSRTNEPVTYIANATQYLSSTGTTGLFQAKLKFPPAPDGLDKADGTGRFASLAEAITAGGDSLSASVIHRQDLVILESWDEDISEKGNVLYPYGNVQYGGSWSGITLATSHVAQGYSAFFVGDTTTTGKGFILDLTNDNHVKFLQDKDNNCYTDNGKIIQRRYRIRTIAGLEGTWNGIKTAGEGFINHTYSGSVDGILTPQGTSTTLPAMKSQGESGIYRIDNDFERGTWRPANNDGSLNGNFGYNGNCWAIPIALVQRRNQGAYHPTYNVAGSNLIMYSDGSNSGAKWHTSSAKDISNASQCFDFFLAAGTNTTGNNSPFADGVDGRTGTVSGRPDGYFYDAIYASDVLDLRLSAHKKSPDEVLRESWQDAIAGKVRGWESLPFVSVVQTDTSSIYYNTSTPSGEKLVKVTGYAKTDNLLLGSTAPYTLNLQGRMSGYISINNILYDTDAYWSDLTSDWVFRLKTSGNIINGTSVEFAILWEDTKYYQAEPTWTDIVCRDIADLAATFPDGVGGVFNPEGFNLSGNQSAEYIELTKKALSASPSMLHTDNQGASWGVYTPTLTLTTNTGIHQSTNTANLVALWNYKTKANFTKSANLGVVKSSIGEMFSTNHSSIDYGCILMSSTIGKIATETSGNKHVSNQPLSGFTYQYTGKLLPDIPAYPVTHTATDLTNLTGSPTLKCFGYVSDNNGIQTIQIPFKEMVWDSGAGTVITVSSNAAYSYESGKVYKLDHADFRNLEGTFWQFKIDTTNTASQIADSLEAHLQGVLSESGVARLWDGNGFGDNNKFEITNGVKNMLDQNGNTILYGTHQFNTKYWSYN